MIGSGIEFEIRYMDKIKDLNKKMLIVDSSKGIELIEVKSKKYSNENEAEIKGEKDPSYLDFIKNGKTMIQKYI